MCPACMDCRTAPGAILVQENYAFVSGLSETERVRPSKDIVAFTCPFAGACLAESSLNLSVSGSNCAHGYSGLLCGTCDVGFSKSDDKCMECSGSAVATALAVVLLVLLVVAGLKKLMSHFGEHELLKIFSELKNQFNPVVKSVVSMAQILCSFKETLDIELPGVVQGAIDSFRAFMLVDAFQVMQLSCVLGESLLAPHES